MALQATQLLSAKAKSQSFLAGGLDLSLQVRTPLQGCANSEPLAAFAPNACGESSGVRKRNTPPEVSGGST